MVPYEGMISRFPPFSFVAGVLLGLLGALAWFSGDFSALPTLPFQIGMSARLATTTSTASSETGAVSVVSQPAGMSVRIESVTVSPPGVWVAVREVAGKDLGNVLGALRVGTPRTDVSVSLLRTTTPGQRYAVELYRDDGDGTFDPTVDSVYVDLDTGMPAIAYFNTTE